MNHLLGEIVLYRHWDMNVYAGIVTRVHPTNGAPEPSVSIHIFYPEAVEQRSERLGDIECVRLRQGGDDGETAKCWLKTPYTGILG